MRVPVRSLTLLMPIPHPKKKHYEELMIRMTRAITTHNCLEASWYSYAVLEDRLIAILSASGGAHEKNKPSKLMRNFGRRLRVIDERRKKDNLLKAYFPDSLISTLTKWKNERNDLMHAMANAAVPLSDIDKLAYLLATNGQKHVKEVCRVTRLLKRNRTQIPVPAKPYPY